MVEPQPGGEVRVNGRLPVAELNNLTGVALPVGVVDHPREQRHDPLVVRLDDGHVAVVGGPRSGTSTLLRTIVSALSLTTTSLESPLS